MTHIPEQDEQLERMLNAWGRSKASARLARWAWWRWAPLAASLVFAAAGAMMMGRAAQGPQAAGGRPSPTSEQVQALQARLTAAESLNDQLRRQLVAAKEETDYLFAQLKPTNDELARTKSELGRLNRELVESKIAEAEDQAQIQEMMGFMEEIEKRSYELAEKLAAAETQVASMRATAQSSSQATEKLQSDLANLQEEHAKLKLELDQMRQYEARRSAAVTLAWHAAIDREKSSVGVNDLMAMQAALRAANLLDNATDAAKLSDSQTVEVVRRLETVFSRLSMADPANETEEQWATDVVRGDLLDQIAAALAEADARRLPEDVRIFLIQSQIILQRGACGS